MSVMNRKMFNRGARKELRKKGGIEDVQYFQNVDLYLYLDKKLLVL